MEVVDDADVVVSQTVQFAANRNQILWVSSPVEMVVEAEWGTQFFGPFGKRHYSFGGCSDFFFLRIYLGRGADLSNLRLKPVFLEELEGLFIFVPKGEVLDAVFLALQDFFFKLRIILLGPVVGEASHSQLRKHYGSFCRAAVRSIPTVCDAPGHWAILPKNGWEFSENARGSSEGNSYYKMYYSESVENGIHFTDTTRMTVPLNSIPRPRFFESSFSASI
jgi:hypothetical protein